MSHIAWVSLRVTRFQIVFAAMQSGWDQLRSLWPGGARVERRLGGIAKPLVGSHLQRIQVAAASHVLPRHLQGALLWIAVVLRAFAVHLGRGKVVGDTPHQQRPRQTLLRTVVAFPIQPQPKVPLYPLRAHPAQALMVGHPVCQQQV